MMKINVNYAEMITKMKIITKQQIIIFFLSSKRFLKKILNNLL